MLLLIYFTFFITFVLKRTQTIPLVIYSAHYLRELQKMNFSRPLHIILSKENTHATNLASQLHGMWEVINTTVASAEKYLLENGEHVTKVFQEQVWIWYHCMISNLLWTANKLQEGEYMEIVAEQWLLPLTINAVVIWAIFYCMVIRKQRNLQRNNRVLMEQVTLMELFDLAKTAYEPGHREALVRLTQKSDFDVNFQLPSSGLSLFLCACLSGDYQLVNYLVSVGADVKKKTFQGDSALYLATFGVLNSQEPCLQLLHMLIDKGCDVNEQNITGYTPLHRAAAKGNIGVVQCLLKNGADPTKVNSSGIYPLDSATNAGHLEVAELLADELTKWPNDYVWDIVEPHTPKQARLGLQSPGKSHLLESTVRSSAIRDGLKSITIKKYQEP